MNFLYPGFLFALLAVAIPILIHLFNFRKYKKVYFSNVHFLKAAKEQNSSREQLRNLLILGSRILAIIFLVFAFSRPYWSGESNYNPEAANQINLYIDNSYSMESVSTAGSLLDEAKRKAKEIVRQFGPNDRFQLSTNDFEARHQRLVSNEELYNLIDDIKISPVQRSLQQVLNRQNNIAAGKKNRYSYILSDFQTQFAGRAPLVNPVSNHLSLIRLKANSLPNIGVDSIWSLSPAHKPGDQEKFVVQIHNYTDKTSEGIPLQLLVNNQQRAVARLTVPAGKSVKDTLMFGGLGPGWQKAVVSIKDYPLTFDDELQFSFKVNTGLNVLHISGDPNEKYIKPLFAADSYFQLSSMPESNIVYADFAKYNLIVLSGLKSPSSGLAQQLKSFVSNGGSVVLFPDLDSTMPLYSGFLTSLGLPAVNALNRDTIQASQINLKSKLFTEVFEEMPKKPDLPKLNRYFTYQQQNSRDREDLLSLPGGRPFFSRFPSGAGQFYLSATSLKTEDSNLPRHPLFVPLLYKIAFSSVQEQPLYYVIGQNNLLTAAQLDLNPNESLRLSLGSTEVIPEIRQVPGKTLLYIADQVKTAGFYQLYKGNTLLATYAFNESRAESDMHYAADKELQQLFGANKPALANSQTALSALTVENNRMELWKLCLVLCAVFLAVEALLIRFFNLLKI
jgi:hypothetical protein